MPGLGTAPLSSPWVLGCRTWLSHPPPCPGTGDAGAVLTSTLQAPPPSPGCEPLSPGAAHPPYGRSSSWLLYVKIFILVFDLLTNVLCRSPSPPPPSHPILNIMVLITADDCWMTKQGGQTVITLRGPSLSYKMGLFFFFFNTIQWCHPFAVSLGLY